MDAIEEDEERYDGDIGKLFEDLSRSRHNNIFLSRPYLKEIKKIDKPKDLYIQNDYMDEDSSHRIQSRAVLSLGHYHTLVEKLKLLDGWVELGNYDYPSLILILCHLKNTLKEACFFRILQRRPSVLEIYIHHLEQQLEHSKLYFTELRNLYTFLGRDDDKVYLQLRFAVYEQKKRRLRNVEERYVHDIQNFTRALNLIAEIQQKDTYEKKKGIKSKLEEDHKTMSKEQQRKLNEYDLTTQVERETVRKKTRIEVINHLAEDLVKSTSGPRWEKEKIEIGSYINLIDREKQIEIYDTKFNQTPELQKQYQEEKEAERLESKKRKRIRKTPRRGGKSNRKRSNRGGEEEVRGRRKSNMDPFRKENLFREYPRKCIYNLNCSEFFKYLLFYHFQTVGHSIVSPEMNRETFQLSPKRYSLLALDSRSRVGDWKAVANALPSKKKKKKKGSGEGWTGLFFKTKSSGLILPVETVLEVVSKYHPPRMVMSLVLEMEEDFERRFILAKSYQCFEVAVIASEMMEKEVRVERLKSLKSFMNRVFGTDFAAKLPVMEKINYYIQGGKVKRKKGRAKSWFNFNSGGHLS